MGAGRKALLVATHEHQDTGLSRLTAPPHDTEALAAVLSDADIAGFDVQVLINEPADVVGRAVGRFYGDCRRDDLTLLYFSGHGVKDASGRLYFAMADTELNNLLFTGLKADTVNEAMENCLSGRKVLILDCCYSGAFPAGFTARADPAVHTLERFQGKGRAVLTASDATQYAFEGNRLVGSGEPSVFTRHLVEAIRSGGADYDGDGNIEFDELYTYVRDHVTAEMPGQKPSKQLSVDGRLVLATNVHWTMPQQLKWTLESADYRQRLAAVDALVDLHRRGNERVRVEVLERLRALSEDDSKSVSAAATARLEQLTGGAAPDPEPDPAEARRLEEERREKERREAEARRLESERLEKEQVEAARRREAERLEAEQEAIRLAAEQAAAQAEIDREAEREAERQAALRRDAERKRTWARIREQARAPEEHERPATREQASPRPGTAPFPRPGPRPPRRARTLLRTPQIAWLLAVLAVAAVPLTLSRTLIYENANWVTAADLGWPSEPWAAGVVLPLFGAAGLLLAAGTVWWALPVAVGLVLGAVVGAGSQAFLSVVHTRDTMSGWELGAGWGALLLGVGVLVGWLLVAFLMVPGRGGYLRRPSVRVGGTTAVLALAAVAAFVVRLVLVPPPAEGFDWWLLQHLGALILAAVCLVMVLLELNGVQRLAALAALTVGGLTHLAVVPPLLAGGHYGAPEHLVLDVVLPGAWIVLGYLGQHPALRRRAAPQEVPVVHR